MRLSRSRWTQFLVSYIRGFGLRTGLMCLYSDDENQLSSAHPLRRGRGLARAPRVLEVYVADAVLLARKLMSSVLQSRCRSTSTTTTRRMRHSSAMCSARRTRTRPGTWPSSKSADTRCVFALLLPFPQLSLTLTTTVVRRPERIRLWRRNSVREQVRLLLQRQYPPNLATSGGDGAGRRAGPRKARVFVGRHAARGKLP